MQQTLPAVVASLGQGWFEYGLVEEAFARQHPSDFAQLVDRWGHTAIESRTYTASSYLARVLGDLSRLGSVAYHPGKGTGRWSYDVLVSYWSALPAPAWKQRTSWLDVHGASQTAADDPCRSYVPGS